MPSLGKGIVQKLLNLKKKGSQISKVGIKEESIIRMNSLPLFSMFKC